MASAALLAQFLNRELGSAYRVEEVLEMDDLYLDQLRISATLAERARRFWGGEP
ncbi:MAG: hypothetical protein GX605_11790 [Chloroflexi bacterium]|nr:hypothetical protein [Chloroflexota bacterium]